MAVLNAKEHELALTVIRNIDTIVDKMASDREYTEGIDDIRVELAKVLNND